MKILKIALVILLVAASYRMFRQYVLGIPDDPQVTLQEWSDQMKATIPYKITETITLKNV